VVGRRFYIQGEPAKIFHTVEESDGHRNQSRLSDFTTLTLRPTARAVLSRTTHRAPNEAARSCRCNGPTYDVRPS
jgi:hypothetical protein